MSNLSNIENDTFDIVISIFTSFSYTDDVEKTIREISRVLKPNGKLFISSLSKYSLRRLLKWKFGLREKYQTRHSRSKTYSFAWVFSIRKLKELFIKHGFININVTGYNALAGLPLINNNLFAWKINLIFSNSFPILSHELILTANIKK